MQHIYVLNPKGGCGKTTISAQLAGYYSGEGLSVLVVDHDQQRCVTDWLTARYHPNSTAEHIASLIAPNEGRVDPEELGCDLVIHDMPAAWSITAPEKMITRKDRVLIPVLPSPQDIKSCVRFVMSLYRSGALEQEIQIGLIANRVKPGINYSQVLREFLERQEIPFVAELRDSQNYVRSMDEGLTIFDLAPSRVKKDIGQWQAIIDWLNIDTNKDVRPPRSEATAT